MTGCLRGTGEVYLTIEGSSNDYNCERLEPGEDVFYGALMPFMFTKLDVVLFIYVVSL